MERCGTFVDAVDAVDGLHPSSFLFLVIAVVMPGVTSSFLLLIAIASAVDKAEDVGSTACAKSPLARGSHSVSQLRENKVDPFPAVLFYNG